MVHSKLKEYVYIVTDNSYCKINHFIKQRYKIGKTINPIVRFEELKSEQCCCSSNFMVNYLIETDDMTKLETFLHRKYKEIRVDTKKEWFCLDIEDFDIFIKKYCEDNLITKILHKDEYNKLNTKYKTNKELLKKDIINKNIKIGVKPEEKHAGMCVYTRVKIIQQIILNNKTNNIKELLDQKIKFKKDIKGLQYEEIYKWNDLKYDINHGYFEVE
jgi:hypothetical protein